MTVLPLAGPDSSFSDAIVCRFRLRPLEIDEGRRSFTFGPEESELVFACTFEEPRPGADGATPVQYGVCTAPSGETARFRVHDERGGRERRPARLRGPALGPVLHRPAGLAKSRSRPAGSPSRSRVRTTLTARTSWASSSRSTAGRCSRAAGTPLFAVVGETVVAGKLPIRIERFGRPEIKNVIMSTKEFDQVNRDLEIRDLYNLEDAFHMSKDYRGVYRARLNANLAAIDRLDGKTDWPLGPDGAHPLTELLLDDYLVVDVSKPFAEDSYFEIERAVLQGRPARDVRWPIAERRPDGHHLHAARQCRQRAARQRRRAPGDAAGVRRLPLPGATQFRAPSEPQRGHVRVGSRPWRRKEATMTTQTDRHPGGRRHSGPVAASPPHPLRRRRDSRAHRRPARRPGAGAPPHSIRPLR